MDLTSPATLAYAQSPPNMEGAVAFVAPELKSETLMDREHQSVLKKLQYICNLTSCLIDLAQTRTAPLLESPNTANKLSGCIVIVSEKQRRIEQLILYIRAMDLISPSLLLAQDAISSNELQTTGAVKEGMTLWLKYSHLRA